MILINVVGEKILLGTLFLPHEVDAILQIPLNPAWPEDKLIWNYTSNAIYTVKSGYRVDVDFTNNSTLTNSHSSMNQESRLWNYIHSLLV